MSDIPNLSIQDAPPTLRAIADRIAAWRPPEGVDVQVKVTRNSYGWEHIEVKLRPNDSKLAKWQVICLAPENCRDGRDIKAALDSMAAAVTKTEKRNVNRRISKSRSDLALRVCSNVPDADLKRVADAGGLAALLAKVEGETR
jgi:hypothetical protein